MKSTNTFRVVQPISNPASQSLGPKPIVFRGEHPDTRTDKQWVLDMVKKYPELDWLSEKQKKKAGII